MSHSEEKRAIRRRARRVVVKLGSSVVTTSSGMHRERVGLLVAEIAKLCERGLQVLVVTSGARAAGLSRLGLKSIPRAIPEQQAAAAIGQINLMGLYERFFRDFGKSVGQVLLTAADIEDRVRYLNAKHTIDHLLRHDVVPVVNENDSVAVDELKFGDNDRLSALVAGLASADLLILLTDVEGLYDRNPADPAASLVSLVRNVDDAVRAHAGKAGTLGTGGMATKLEAAASAAHRGIPTIIANGTRDGILSAILESEEETGTLVLADASPISNRKHWIAYGVPIRGTLTLDDGAVRALSERGGSLLPSGIVSVRGRYRAGDCVGLVDGRGDEFARGLVNYDAADCDRIKGRASTTIQEALGFHMGDEVIHRDDLVLLKDVGESPGDPK
jgi:glutamate 5-kinase